MQKKYKDKVTIIGVSDEKVDTVKKFVGEMGDRMDYVVAVDDDKATGQAYMGEFGIDGIPHAFVVSDGRIVWHENPYPTITTLGEVLDLVIKGRFDDKAIEHVKQLQRQKQEEVAALDSWRQEYFELVRSTGKKKEAAELGRKIIERGKDNVKLMSEFAWKILTGEGVVNRDYRLALRAAEFANEMTGGENASVLDTYAFALFETGSKKEAVKIQTKAVKLAREQSGPDSEMTKQLEGRLERFKNEIETP